MFHAGRVQTRRQFRLAANTAAGVRDQAARDQPALAGLAAPFLAGEGGNEEEPAGGLASVSGLS